MDVILPRKTRNMNMPDVLEIPHMNAQGSSVLGFCLPCQLTTLLEVVDVTIAMHEDEATLYACRKPDLCRPECIDLRGSASSEGDQCVDMECMSAPLQIGVP